MTHAPVTHFLTLSSLPSATLHALLRRARALKPARTQVLQGKTVGLVFEKASTRTRVSFEVAMNQLGGRALVLPQSESQMHRGESLADTARVLSGYLDAIVMRTSTHARLEEFARAATVPVINGLTDTAHPAQLLADLLTVLEHVGELAPRTIAFVGDGNSNMALSWIEAASIFGFDLRVAAPHAYWPSAKALAAHPGRITLTDDPVAAVAGAEVVNTDVWTSMGQEEESAKRRAALARFSVDAALLSHAHKDAIVLHCLPAHRGEEISAEVLDGPQARVWQQAENRLHAQKALLELLLLEEKS
jgi:ornithine carbamoyltransferase